MNFIRYRSGYKYQLAEEYSLPVRVNFQQSILKAHRSTDDAEAREGIETEYIDLSVDGVLTVKSGYAWDGPSGPTFDTKSFMRGSLVHDALYQLMRGGYLPESCREDADQELHRICREDGMNRFRAWYVLLGVRKAAGFAASSTAEKKIYTAPYGRG